MVALIALTVFFLVFMVLVGLVAKRADRLRDEESTPGSPQTGH